MNLFLLLIYQVEKMTIVQIYEYFEYTISFEYISDIITNTEYNDEYFF